MGLLRNRGISDEERSRLPPGQHLVRDFPVLHAGSASPTAGAARLGLPRHRRSWTRPLRWTMEELRAQTITSVTCDIHCVTSWTKLDTVWEGVAVAPLLRGLGIDAVGDPRRRPRRGGLHRQHAPRPGCWPTTCCWPTASTAASWSPSTAARCGCCVPSLYFWKSAKWLRGLELLDHDEPGFWERLGYSNTRRPVEGGALRLLSAGPADLDEFDQVQRVTQRVGRGAAVGDPDLDRPAALLPLSGLGAAAPACRRHAARRGRGGRGPSGGARAAREAAAAAAGAPRARAPMSAPSRPRLTLGAVALLAYVVFVIRAA